MLIQGKSFPGITGGPLANYRVYACQTGQFLPIRFQIDEMTEEGDFIFPYGKLSNIKRSNGTPDERDILLFMAKDAGNRVSQAYWPENVKRHGSLTNINITFLQFSLSKITCRAFDNISSDSVYRPSKFENLHPRFKIGYIYPYIAWMNMAIMAHAQGETEILLPEEPQIFGALGAALLSVATR